MKNDDVYGIILVAYLLSAFFQATTTLHNYGVQTREHN